MLSILEQGLKLPISEEIPQYEEKNNKSALDNFDILRDKVNKWEEQGYVSRVQSKPHCVSPMSVASKVDLKTGEIKRRPCLDLSRHINDYLVHWPVKLADLDASADLLSPGDWQSVLDLENMYFHVSIHHSHRKYLGFKIQDGNGPIQYYVFNVMIYGIKVHCKNIGYKL